MRESAGDEVIAVCPRKLMRHAQEGVEMGIGCREGAVAVLTHANSQTDDTDGSTTAVVAVMQPPNVCEVIACSPLLSAAPLNISEGLCTFQVLGAMRALITFLKVRVCRQIASVGDSGFRLVREGDCIFASEVGDFQPLSHQHRITAFPLDVDHLLKRMCDTERAILQGM